MTARVCKALAHPATTMLGHATGRLLLRREGYKIDLDDVLKCAAKHGKMIEINAQPTRLDLDWTYVRKAKAMGIPIVINPDAHSDGELALFAFGVDVARRGWLEAKDVFNTRPLSEVIRELERRRSERMIMISIAPDRCRVREAWPDDRLCSSTSMSRTRSLRS